MSDNQTCWIVTRESNHKSNYFVNKVTYRVINSDFRTKIELFKKDVNSFKESGKLEAN